MDTLHPDTQIIDHLGGATAVARMCGGISPQAVSNWRRAGIPNARRMYLQLLHPTAFQRRDEQSSVDGEGEHGAVTA